MNNHAVITGSLMDMRNIGTDKSLKLTIHIPVEMTLAAINCFGWPTSVDPVPVVVARIDLEKDPEIEEDGCD